MESKRFVLKATHLRKFLDRRLVIEDVSIELEEGEICGMIGVNGAGKTTTLKMIAGLTSKDGGRVVVAGYDIDKEYMNAIQKVGVSLECVKLYEDLTGFENLKLVANLCRGDKYEVEYLLELMGFGTIGNSIKVKNYSTGMKKKLELARTLLNKPKLIILDEPTNGLDPKSVKEIYQIIKKMAHQENVSFIISSHILYDVQRLCDKIIMIDKGRIILEGKMTEKLKSEGKTLEQIFFKYIEGEKNASFI